MFFEFPLGLPSFNIDPLAFLSTLHNGKESSLFKLLKYLIVFFVLSFVLIIGVFLFTLESEPLVVTSSSKQVDQAESVKALMQQLRGSINNRKDKQVISISQEQLNSLVGFAQRANRKFSGQVNITPKSTRVAVTYQLPSNPIGDYLNIDMSLLPGPGVFVEHVKIGPISLPGDFALSTLVTLANWYTSSDIATQFIQQIEQVSMGEQQILLSVFPLEAFLKELNEAKKGVGGVTDEELRIATAYYLQHLSSLDVSDRITSQSLVQYTAPLFTWTKNRSTSAESAAKENKAAIMALAIFVGHHRFANLVGDVQPEPGRVALPNAKAILNSRVDLNQHFIFSAAIKIFSEQGISVAIGEFKELMDRSYGGSGYSFVDLAADFAGVKFAEVATNPLTAIKLQHHLAGNVEEKALMPDVSGLPEGLSKAEFEQRFTKVDSPEYTQMVDDINQRIADLPGYQ